MYAKKDLLKTFQDDIDKMKYFVSLYLQVVELLLLSNLCSKLLVGGPQDMENNERTTCLHLAAKNGHADIIRYVLV